MDRIIVTLAPEAARVRILATSATGRSCALCSARRRRRTREPRRRCSKGWPERTVADVFAKERQRLLAPPDPLPTTDLVAPIAVDRSAFVKIDTNRYSLPHRYAGRHLTLVANEILLRFLDGDEEVASHTRSWARNECREIPAHRAALVAETRPLINRGWAGRGCGPECAFFEGWKGRFVGWR